MSLIAYFRSHPLRTGFFLMACYFVYLVMPDALGPESFGRGQGIETAKDMNELLVSEAGMVISILLVIAVLGLWKECGFTLKFHQGGLKFIVPPFLFTSLLLAFAIANAESEGLTIVKVVGRDTLITLAIVTLLVGIFEESLFRGVIFAGWERRFGPMVAVFVSAAFFGVFHFVNWVDGQPFGQSAYQSLHAFYIGIMYAALRLRVGSILPVIFLHGFWDAAVTIVGTTNAALGTATAKTLSDTELAGGNMVAGFLFSAVEPVYGLFVLWRWHVWRKRRKAAQE